MNRTIRITLIFIACIISTSHTQSQPTGSAIEIGERFTIESKVLNEQRSVLVGLPATYGLGHTHYPVLYLLDGSSHFHYTTGITSFLAGNEFMPEMIVIGVNNTDRTRDMTPPSQEPNEVQFLPTHGGADNFVRVFAEDLIPWVEQNYRTQPYRILIGHSFGGLFAIHTLTTNPELFNAYIAISPSMQWNGQRSADQAAEFFSVTERLPVTLYMTTGNEGGPLLGGTRKIAAALDSTTPKEFLWRFDHMPEETHGTVPHRSTYQGLEFVFANWALRNPFDVYTRYGMEAIEKFYAFGDQRYGTDRGIPLMTISYLLGNMVKSGDLSGAVALMSHPSALNNAPGAAHAFLASALQASGDQAQSIKFYRQALQRNPGDREARNALEEQGADYTDLIPHVSVTDDILQTYAGTYTSPMTGDIRVWVEEGRLFREVNNTRFELNPLSDSEFYLFEDDVRYDFLRTDEGSIRGVQINLGGTLLYLSRQ